MLVVNNPLPAMQVRSLGREDPLEEEMATHSSIIAWKILWTGEPGGLQFMGSQRIKYDGAHHNFNELIMRMTLSSIDTDSPVN